MLHCRRRCCRCHCRMARAHLLSYRENIVCRWLVFRLLLVCAFAPFTMEWQPDADALIKSRTNAVVRRSSNKTTNRPLNEKSLLRRTILRRSFLLHCTGCVGMSDSMSGNSIELHSIQFANFTFSCELILFRSWAKLASTSWNLMDYNKKWTIAIDFCVKSILCISFHRSDSRIWSYVQCMSHQHRSMWTAIVSNRLHSFCPHRFDFQAPTHYQTKCFTWHISSCIQARVSGHPIERVRYS